MPIKEININNNYYKIVCKEGQEQHLNVLADKLNNRIRNLKENFKGKCSELALLVLVALELEDQLSEKGKNINDVVTHITTRISKVAKIFDKRT